MTGLSVKKPFTVLVVVVIVFALGVMSFRGMKPELLPNIELPFVITMTAYPGATSENVEAEVTRPLEQGFATLEGLKSISSQSRANFSMVMLEFVDGANLDGITLDMLQRISQAEGRWDDLVGTPIIIKMNPSMLPVMIAAVEREGAGTAELSRLMEEELELKLEGIDGVASLDVSGLRREQVNVAVRAEKVAEVNGWIADSIKSEIEEKEQDLKDTKSDLQKKLDGLKAKNIELEDGVKEFADKIASGSTELNTGWATWAKTLAELESQLVALEGQLIALKQQQDAATAEAIAAAIAAALEEWEVLFPGVPLPPEMEEAIKAEVTAAVEAEFAPYRKQIKDGIKSIKAGIKALEAAGAQMAEAQGALDSAMIETQFTLSSGAAQLAAAQAQISGGIIQIDQGLEQFEDALETALKQADMSAVLTMGMVSTLLKAQNFEMPAGTVTQGHTDYLVRVGDEVGSMEELKEMALLDTGIDGIGVIRLCDVADVFMSDNISDVYAKINGSDGVLLQFAKQSERSTTEVTDAIMEKFKELEKLYPGLKFTPFLNQGDYIYMVINSITSDLLWGALFAMLILLLFLRDIRPTFITLCAIPISLVFALVAMYFSGVTINIISLSGLAVAVGRLVDDSVVVIENIFRLRAKGFSPIKAAVSGTMQVAGAITASTLTTISVFLPLVFVQGLTRQIFKDFGLTFAFALLASLAVAMTLVPALASGMFRKMTPKEHNWLAHFLGTYDKALVWALRYKPVVLIIAIVMLLASVGAVWTKGFAYMPEGAGGEIAVSMKMPKESAPEERTAMADEASARIRGIEGVSTVGTIASSGGGFGAIGALMGSDRGGGGMRNMTSYVILEDDADYFRVSSDIEAALEGMDMDVGLDSGNFMNAGSLGDSGIIVNIFADETDTLMKAAKAVGEALLGMAGIGEVDDGLEDATPELHFAVDRARAAEYGLTTAQVFQHVSAALTKESNATQVTWRGDNYNVMAVNEYVQGNELTPAYIKSLAFSVTKRDGTTESVRLADISSVSESVSLPSIQRSEQRRYLPVSASVGEGYNVTLVAQEVESVLAGLKLPAGVTYKVTGESATIFDAFEQLSVMLILGLLLVYLIMVAQFQSLKSPFIIMFTIPLAFTGGFLALLVTGNILSVVSLIGFAMLVGVIVANAIVLVDYINRLRLDGMERVAAIREGAATRMRPILMTALATIGALIMMALGVGEGSDLMQPLAIVCIGGLAYGTLMTLFVIPIIYDTFNKKELRKIDEDDLIVDREA